MFIEKAILNFREESDATKCALLLLKGGAVVAMETIEVHEHTRFKVCLCERVTESSHSKEKCCKSNAGGCKDGSNKDTCQCKIEDDTRPNEIIE